MQTEVGTIRFLKYRISKLQKKANIEYRFDNIEKKEEKKYF